ncbi:MAG TPA: hypothetical protein VFJ96_09395 [Gemmatimonadaceae bacterium]|nr:hypothetical protein [Gemmatimonadaceae bacterium]
MRDSRHSITSRTLRSALLPLMILVCGAGSTHAKAPTVQVARVQDLTFGNVFPGVPITVPLTDSRAGQYTLVNGTGRALTVQLVFVLPSTLATGGGALMPVQFGPASAGFSATGSLGSMVPFDPSIPFTATIAAKTTARVFLGGTLQPTGGQAFGSYTATITLTAL